MPQKSRCHKKGSSFIELLVVMVVVSILASMALPHAKIVVVQNKERELKETLRQVRTAIDHFHQDWKDGKIAKSSNQVSTDGYPTTLASLAEGVTLSGAAAKKKKYLRQLPRNPFTSADTAIEKQWYFIGYQDDLARFTWNKKDIYDIRARSDKKALDGSIYKEW